MDGILTALKKAGRAAFRTREYAALLDKKGYARLVLHRLKKNGEIVLIKNGWWTFPDAMPEAVACEISAPCYISFHSALFLHGLTTQTPMRIQVAVARKTKRYSVLGMEVKEYKVKSIGDFSRKDGILLASPERAFADCLTLPRTSPDIVLIEAVRKIDVEKAKKLVSSAAAQKRLRRAIRHAKQE
jgi:predicted transcriptional regulator of viral defense system